MDHKMIIVMTKLLCQNLHQIFTTAQSFHTVHSLGFLDMIIPTSLWGEGLHPPPLTQDLHVDLHVTC